MTLRLLENNTELNFNFTQLDSFNSCTRFPYLTKRRTKMNEELQVNADIMSWLERQVDQLETEEKGEQ